MTEDQLRTMNMLELSARAALRENPDLADGFDSYYSYSQQLAQMDPSERETTLRELREEAASEVDPYWDRETERVREDLKVTMQNLDAQFGLFNENEKFQLGQKINGLTRSAAEDLAERFLDLKRRGTLDSGIARTFADKIIEGKTRAEDFEQATSELRVKQQEMVKEQSEDRVNRAANRDIEDIGYNKETDRNQAFFGLLAEEEARTFLQQYGDASRLKTYDQSATAPAATPAAIPGRAMTTAKAPAGSSLEIARRATAGEIGLDEQRRLRDQLLNPSVPTARPVSRAATPSVPKAPVKTASTAAGQRLLQNAAARGAARSATNLSKAR
jgi:hypothetical protein